MSEQVVESFADSILEIKIAINEQNTFTLEGFAALDAALEKAAARDDVRALILASGRDDFFSNGLNPTSIHGRPREEHERLIGHFFSVLKRIYLFPTPVVGAINGHAVGYGAMLAIMCDFRLLVDKGARMSFPEMNIGVTLPTFVTTRIADLCGERALRDFLFAGLAPKPPEALAVGLADELVEKEKLADRARSLAKRLAGLPRNAVRLQKGILRNGTGRDFDALIAADLKATLGMLSSKEALEGFAAMVEKRRPKFD